MRRKSTAIFEIRTLSTSTRRLRPAIASSSRTAGKTIEVDRKLGVPREGLSADDRRHGMIGKVVLVVFQHEQVVSRDPTACGEHQTRVNKRHIAQDLVMRSLYRRTARSGHQAEAIGLLRVSAEGVGGGERSVENHSLFQGREGGRPRLHDRARRGSETPPGRRDVEAPDGVAKPRSTARSVIFGSTTRRRCNSTAPRAGGRGRAERLRFRLGPIRPARLGGGGGEGSAQPKSSEQQRGEGRGGVFRSSKFRIPDTCATTLHTGAIFWGGSQAGEGGPWWRGRLRSSFAERAWVAAVAVGRLGWAGGAIRGF